MREIDFDRILKIFKRIAIVDSRWDDCGECDDELDRLEATLPKKGGRLPEWLVVILETLYKQISLGEHDYSTQELAKIIRTHREFFDNKIDEDQVAAQELKMWNER